MSNCMQWFLKRDPFATFMSITPCRLVLGRDLTLSPIDFNKSLGWCGIDPFSWPLWDGPHPYIHAFSILINYSFYYVSCLVGICLLLDIGDMGMTVSNIFWCYDLDVQLKGNMSPFSISVTAMPPKCFLQAVLLVLLFLFTSNALLSAQFCHTCSSISQCCCLCCVAALGNHKTGCSILPFLTVCTFRFLVCVMLSSWAAPESRFLISWMDSCPFTLFLRSVYPIWLSCYPQTFLVLLG
jgi:hypothetical protein